MVCQTILGISLIILIALHSIPLLKKTKTFIGIRIEFRRAPCEVYIYNVFVIDRVRGIFDEFRGITKFAYKSNLTYPNLT